MLQILEKRNLLLNNNLVAVDWDSNHLRLLSFMKERSGEIKVLRAAIEPIDPAIQLDDAQSLGTFIKQILAKNQIRASGLVLAVGRERAFLHQLTIPASPEDEVANLVRFQLAQELPFAIEESTVDYRISERNDAGQVIGVVAAAVRTEYIDFLQHVARVVGIKIRRIGLRPHANFLAVQHSGFLKGGATLFVELTLHGMEIDIFSETGGIIFSRSAGLSEDQTRTTPLSEPFLENAILQIKRTLQAQVYLLAGSDSRPKKLIVTGTTGWEKKFLDRATALLNLTGRVYELPESENHAPESSAAFASVFGMAMAQFQPRIAEVDFLFPKRAVDPQAVRTRQIQLGIAALAAVLILAFIFTQSVVSGKKKNLENLNKTISTLKAKEAEFKKFNTQVEQINKWSDRTVNWLDQLSSLSKILLPTSQVYLTHTYMAESTNDTSRAEIAIQGQADSRRTVDQLAQKLADSGRYKVTPGQQVTMERADKYPESFKLNLSVLKQASAKKEITPEPNNAQPKPAPPQTNLVENGRPKRIVEKIKSRMESKHNGNSTEAVLTR